jgi:hypothetical protein
MMHVNQALPRRVIDNVLRMGNPLGFLHRALDDKADALIDQQTIDQYLKLQTGSGGGGGVSGR